MQINDLSAAEQGGELDDRGGRRDAPIRMETEAFRAAGHRLVDQVADLLASVPGRRVNPGEGPDAVRSLIGGTAGLPRSGEDPEELLRSAADLLFDHSLFNGHPRFFGYITSSAAPIGALADFLAAAVNPNVGGWRLAPLATEIEAQTVRWIAELVGYPTDAGGLLVSGGNMANLVCFFAARAARAPWPVQAAGVAGPGAVPLRVYTSAETHTWVQKASDLSGLGTDAVRWIHTDAALKMDLDALRAAIRRDRGNGDVPMMVIGTAGSVSTGVVDPLRELAALCREEDVWFHVDGAYGALAAAAEGAPDDLAALDLADSLAVDPHKWMYAPLEAGCALVRDREALRRAFSYHPPYYHFGTEATNFVDFGPQNSRGFRALKVWLALRQVGRDGYARMIADDMRLSRRMHARIEAQAELEAVTQALSIATFRYVPTDLRPRIGTERVDLYLNRLNEEVLERIQVSGEAFVSNAVVRGRYLLRACIVNFNTEEADVDAVPGIVTRLGREVDGEMRGEM